MLDCGITDASWTEYEAVIKRLAVKSGVNAEVVRHVIDMTAFSKFSSWNGSKAAWARFFIPHLLPDVDYCVYSDCDMLFVADPHEMLEVLKGQPNLLLAGHLEPGDHSRHKSWCDQKGLFLDETKYLCSGLLVMNLAAFRSENLVEKCFALAKAHPDMTFGDQTTLNSVCFGRTALLPDGWGLFLRECPAFAGRVKSIHFVPCRCWPWNVCTIWQHVLCLKLAWREFSLWCDFEKYILGMRGQPLVKQPFRLWAIVFGVLLAARIGNLFGFRFHRGEVQKYVASFDNPSLALASARHELFGDGSQRCPLGL